MALSIYTHDNPTSNMQQTHKYNSCAFSIGLSTKSFKDCLSQLPQIQGQYIDHIAGIADENIDVGYETSWGESPGAKIAGKLKEFTRTDAFKMFSGGVFNPNPVSNKWTQIFPKDGANIKAGIKFRAYYKANYTNTSSYMTIIPWLTFLTSPMTEFSLVNEMNNIRNAVAQAEQAGEELGKEMEGIRKENGVFTDKAASALALAYNKIKDLATDSRGTAVFTLEFGDLIKAVPDIDWIITDWSFTPSMVMTEKQNPMWCDFQINMETNQKLSYAKLSRLFKFTIENSST